MKIVSSRTALHDHALAKGASVRDDVGSFNPGMNKAQAKPSATVKSAPAVPPPAVPTLTREQVELMLEAQKRAFEVQLKSVTAQLLQSISSIRLPEHKTASQWVFDVEYGKNHEAKRIVAKASF